MYIYINIYVYEFDCGGLGSLILKITYIIAYY